MFQNPFTGSKLVVEKRFLEDEVNLEEFNSIEKEDENERFILYVNGTLIRKTKNEKKYFPTLVLNTK